jgi:carbamoyl-phosphate synthase large subunit
MTLPIVAVTGLNRGENPQPGYAVVRSLRRVHPEMTIIGLVYDAMESGIFADDGPDWSYTVPYPTAGTQALLERLDFIRTRHPIDILIPNLDAEIEPLIRLEAPLAERGIKTFLPTLDSFRARSKSNLRKLCQSCDCETPGCEQAFDFAETEAAAEEIGYPVMLKGQFYDAHRAGDEAELSKAFREITRVWGVPVLIQECIAGGEINVMGLGDGDGNVASLCCVRKMIVSSKGKGLAAVTLREPRLEEITRRIVMHLKWRGPFELELMHDESSDVFHIIEMNPRFPAWVDFPSALGLNYPSQIVSLLTEGTMGPTVEIPPGRFFLRHQTELIGSMDELAALMTEGIWQSHRSRA